jgi:outer membrane protein assembly factor BamA
VGLEAIPGPRVRVSQVEIEGLRKLDTSAVRSMLSVHPGDILSRGLLYQSQRDLYAMGLFRSATVTLADSVPQGPGDTLARVLVSTVEGPRHRVRAGIGYATLECFRVQAGWTAADFIGGARSLDVSGRVAKLGVSYPFNAGFRKNICNYLEGDLTVPDTLTFNVSATLRQPVFLSPRHNANVGVFAERRSEFKAYQREAVGLNMGVTFNARRTVPVTLNYGYSVGRTQAQDAVYCSVFSACTQADRDALRERRAFAAVTLTGVRDKTNSPLDPTRGNTVTLTLTHASRFVGSDSGYKFNRAELEVSRFHPLGRRTVFAWRVKAGAILPETFATTAQAARYVPPDQRFYAGGPNTVRGFRLNDLGPRVYVITDSTKFDSTAAARGDTIYEGLRTFATGGNSVFLANAELRFASPVWPQWVRLGAFVDVGQMYERQGGFVSFDNVRVTPGVGVRVTTPLGPVRLDVAYNGYAREGGPLFLQQGDTLTQIRNSYPSRGIVPRRFVDRLVFQFAIGQAY